jgi:hypothetical protein
MFALLPSRRLLVGVPTAVGFAVALAGCGGTGPSSAAASGAPNPAAHAEFLKFSQCMRSHGVPNFPDPSAGGGIRLDSSSGLDPRSPSFQSAQQTCRKLLPGGGPPRDVPAAQRREMLANAECMRKHGVPNFPDPTFPKGGGVGVGLPPGISPQSPAFQAAAKACGGAVAVAVPGGP